MVTTVWVWFLERPPLTPPHKPMPNKLAAVSVEYRQDDLVWFFNRSLFPPSIITPYNLTLSRFLLCVEFCPPLDLLLVASHCCNYIQRRKERKFKSLHQVLYELVSPLACVSKRGIAGATVRSMLAHEERAWSCEFCFFVVVFSCHAPGEWN